MNIRSILVVTDLSARENAAVERASQLALAHEATLKLMYVPASGRKVPPAAARRLADAARQLEEGLDLQVGTAPVKPGALDDLVAQARGMDLIVLPHRHERSTAAFFRGQPVLRLLRRSNRPVLVVRRSQRAPYGRVLVAVDFSETSEALVKVAARVATGAELEIFHAINTLDESKLRSAEAPEHAVRAYRQRRQLHAQQRIASLTGSLDARHHRVLAAIGRGDPGRQAVMRQEHTGAELVVVGKQHGTAWDDFFCGSVAHRIMSWGTSDVLVVPQAALQATAPLAARRVAPGTNPALPLRPAGRSLP
jgi:nucleotide-binding universal stress UspA family protein